MSDRPHSLEASGLLGFTRAIRSDEDEMAVRAALKNLPGVHAVAVTRDTARIQYDPDLVGDQQFYEAVKHVDFHASGFMRAA